MDKNEKRLSFLKEYVTDLANNSRQSYKYYGSKYGEDGETVRTWWRSFRYNFYENGLWFAEFPILDEWKDSIKKALESVSTEVFAHNESGVPIPYKGLTPKSVWQAPTKDGIALLHSYKFKDERERTAEFESRLVAIFKDHLKDVSPVEVKYDVTGNGKLLNVYTTDKHVGADTKNPMFGNKYGVEEYRRRMSTIIPTIEYYTTVFGNFDRINIIDLGDSVDGLDGQTSRKGHALDQNLDNIGQYEEYLISHKLLFDGLAERGFANKLAYLCATNDNHSGFFTYITARAVEEYLNAKYPSIITRVEKNFIFHEEYGIHKFLFCHGKDDRLMKYGFPFRLDKRAEDIINDYIVYNKLDRDTDPAIQRQVIHFIKGDLHQSGEEFSKKFRYKNVMSMYGPSNYIQMNYGNGYKGFEFEIFFKEVPHMLGGKLFLQDAK